MLLGSSLQSLPGEGTTEEVHQHVSQRFEVVTTRLFYAQVSVDASVTGRASQVLVLPVGDMEVRLGVAVLLGETEVDDVDLVAALANTHQEVVGFDITVDEVTGVDVLNTGNLRITVNSRVAKIP